MQQSTPILINSEAEEVVVVPKIFESATQAAIEISPSVLKEIDATDQLFHCTYRRPARMMDYKVTIIDVNGDVSYFALFANCNSMTFENTVNEEKWRKSMDDEIDAIERNGTRELSDLSKGQKNIGDKWVYKTKLKKDDKIGMYKTRLVAKGYKQEHGVDYTEVFATVARHDTIRMVISLTTKNLWPTF